MGLIRYAGKLLRNPEGTLANDLNCCCDDTICPPCCARIITGALIDGEILLFVAGDPYSLEGEITTPSGTRTVCNDDEITITFRRDPDSGSIEPGAYAAWDVNWKYVSHSPAVGNGGAQDNLGYIDWGDASDVEYSVTLRYESCYNFQYPEIGLIEIGFRDLSLSEDIVVEACPQQECCELPGECDPCCWLLLDVVTNEDDNTFEFYAPLLGGTGTSFYMIVSVTLPDFGQKRACLESEIQVTVSIGARNHADVINNGQGMDFDVEIEIQGLGYNSAIPVDPDTEPVFLTPGSVIWLNRSVREYTAIASAICKPELRAPGGFVVSVQDNNSGAGATIPITFEECANEEECLCCCPRWCEQGCYFPVDPAVCDLDPRVEPDPWTKIINMEMTYVASENVWNELLDEFGDPVLDEDDNPIYTCDTFRFEQTGPSVHTVDCVDPDMCEGTCPRGLGIFDIPMQAYFCDEPFGAPFNIRIFRQDYTMGSFDFYEFGDIDHIWVVQSLTAGSYWFPAPNGLDGSGFPDDYTYSGDCEGASVSHSVVIDGITYTTNFSFQITRENSDHPVDCEATLPAPGDTGWI
jgi:hypothetical protein